MTTSHADVELIERYLDGRFDLAEAAQFDIRLQTDAGLRHNVTAQTLVRRLVRKHYEHQRKLQVRELHERCYNDPARRTLRLAVEALFNQ